MSDTPIDPAAPEAPAAEPAAPDPFAPVLIQPIGPVFFSAPNVIFGIKAPPGELIRIEGSAHNDGEYQVERWDAESVTVSPFVVDEPAGLAAGITAHWLPQER